MSAKPLAEALNNPSKVTHLALTVKSPTDLDGIERLPKLEALTLKLAGDTIPPALFRAGALEWLQISGKKLRQLPQDIGRLAALRSLTISQTSLISLPDAIGKLDGLKTLHVAGNQLEELPGGLGKCGKLSELDVGRNALRGLLPAIVDLPLTELNAESNKLRELPRGFDKLQSLSRLALDKNPGIDLARFPVLPQLVNLGLRNCKLTALPKELFACSRLQWLSLGMNPLKKIPGAIGQLTALQRLYIWRCGLSEVPPEIGQLTNLEVLEVEKNLLTSLPPELASLQKLRELLLEENQFTTLPEAIFGCANLEKLTAMKNRISELPSGITRLSKLQTLRLEDNPLSRFPADLRPLKALSSFYLSLDVPAADFRAQVAHLPPTAHIMSFEVGDIARDGRWPSDPAPAADHPSEALTFQLGARVSSLAFVEGGIAACSYDALVVFDFEHGERFRRDGYHRFVGASADGSRMLVGSAEHGVLLIDSRTGREEPFWDGAINDGQWSADGSLVVLRAKEHILILDADTRELLDDISEPVGVRFVSLSPDNDLLLYGVKKSARLWSRSQKKERFRVTIDRVGVSSGAVLADGQRALVQGTDDSFKLLDLTAKKQPKPLSIGSTSPGVIAAMPDGASAATVDADLHVRIWNLERGEVEHTLGAHQNDGPVDTLAVSPDGAMLASGGCDKVVRLWRVPPRG